MTQTKSNQLILSYLKTEFFLYADITSNYYNQKYFKNKENTCSHKASKSNNCLNYVNNLKVNLAAPQVLKDTTDDK